MCLTCFTFFCTHIFHLKAKVLKLPFLSHFFVLEWQFFTHSHSKSKVKHNKKISFNGHNSIGIKISNIYTKCETLNKQPHNNNKQKHQWQREMPCAYFSLLLFSYNHSFHYLISEKSIDTSISISTVVMIAFRRPCCVEWEMCVCFSDEIKFKHYWGERDAHWCGGKGWKLWMKMMWLFSRSNITSMILFLSSNVSVKKRHYKIW